MTEKEVVEYIKKRIDSLAQKYELKGEQLLYEQGLLLGILSLLALEDSKNFDIIRRTLNKLK